MQSNLEFKTTPSQPPKSFNLSLRSVQEASEDYEWYPTTKEIIEALKGDLEAIHEQNWRARTQKFLDIGAGDGRVLKAIKGNAGINECFAIEKSNTHLSNMDSNILILGVDFWRTSLADKEVNVIFSNPPYSEYAKWSAKILDEAATNTHVYLVLPTRWKTSSTICEIIEDRKWEVNTIGTYSFKHEADRKARVEVELIRLRIRNYNTKGNDPFNRFFDATFSYPEAEIETKFEENVKKHQLTSGRNLIETLCFLYEERMAELKSNYEAICSLDPSLLKEFQIDKASLTSSLKMKIQSTKKQYWQRLFDGLSPIKKRLTTHSRTQMVNKMQDQTGIDFCSENAYAIVQWVIKNANSYFDDQLIETYQKMVEFANVENYKSNHRVFTKNEFYYHHHKDTESPSHYGLKVGHRIVLEKSGGLERSWSNTGLSKRAAEFIADILTIASNLGFPPVQEAPNDGEWDDSSSHEYTCTMNGEVVTLFKVRTFLNGNMHFQFMPRFIHALNIQHGKLKGWINTHEEAENEANAPAEVSKTYFDHSFKIEARQLLLT